MTFVNGQAQLTLTATSSGTPNGPVVQIGTVGLLEAVSTQTLTNTTSAWTTATLYVGRGTPQGTYVISKLDEGEVAYNRDLFWTGAVDVDTNDLLVFQYETNVTGTLLNLQWRVRT